MGQMRPYKTTLEIITIVNSLVQENLYSMIQGWHVPITYLVFTPVNIFNLYNSKLAS